MGKLISSTKKPHNTTRGVIWGVCCIIKETIEVSMQILQLSIKNFRGIKEFKQTFGEKQIICFVGKGDSGKSTILEAISLALAPVWNITFNDDDFYLKNITSPIEIEVSIKIPQDFILENKFGLYMRFWDKETCTIYDEPNENFAKVLTIKLIVDETLEPKWYVYNKCQEDNVKEIGQADRAKFNCLMISDYIDKHFTWNTGSPLYSLLTSKEKQFSKGNYVEQMRQALCDINKCDFTTLNNCFTDKVEFGLLDLSGTKTYMDAKDIYSNSNKLSIHDKNGVPYRLKGKGTKRLLSTELQLNNIDNGTITLIDEIEQGLEPYRIKNLITTLKTKHSNQIFMTTHSSNVVTELNADDIYILRHCNEKHQALNVPNELQDVVRIFPDVLFAQRIIVCEGKTELGLCKAIDNKRIKNNEYPMSFYGCIPICGEGSKFYEYCEKLNSLEFPLLVFCDSDLKDDDKKAELKSLKIAISDCEEGNCIEKQVFQDLNFTSIKQLLNYVIDEKFEQSEANFIQSVKSKYQQFPEDWQNEKYDTQEIRNALASASLAKSKESDNTGRKSLWFKNETAGRLLGDIIFENYNDIKDDKHIKKQINEIENWIIKN